MNRIRLLSEQVANQIAAGEVVERPASVVKELVENALDAEARQIIVELQAGGRGLIRVTDDGFGMSRDDALLSLERHATSKIRRAEDLSAVTTMGFRGEALPSIASVSRFTLTTREREAAEGTQIVVHGGKIMEVRAAGGASGTAVEVRQLFFNLPARRKFLRTEETERAHVQHYLTLAALAHPEVAIAFVNDGRTVWQLPAARSGSTITDRLEAVRGRMKTIHGAETRLVSVQFEAPMEPGLALDAGEPSQSQEPLRLWGLLGAPGVSRATRDEQHVFVNRRPVENRGLNFALLEGYHTALMKGRYPVCCLFLEIDPAAVDMNIHPAKREVKFHQEQSVRRLVARAVREALVAFHAPPSSPVEKTGAETAPLAGRPALIGLAQSAIRPLAARGADEVPAPPRPSSELVSHAERASPLASSSDSAGSALSFAGPSRPEPSLPWERKANGEQDHPPAIPATDAVAGSGGATPLLQVPLRVVGVIGRLYVVLESDRGLVLIDQHAAHERILFEQMMRRLERHQAPSQRLLLPETLEFTPRDAQFVRGLLPVLQRLGVGLSEFGERTFLLDALPPFVKVPDPRAFALRLVDELKSAGEGVNTLRLGEAVIIKTVCRHAVKANDLLAGPELDHLVEDLRRCEMPYTCPHGRPTILEMSFRELEKKFGRSL